MKKLVAVSFVVLAVAAQAKADGFRCQTVERDLAVQVFNQTQPSQGTRSAAVMVVSDLTGQSLDGNRTIAKFTDAKGRLASQQLEFVGNVDLRVSETSKAGRLISGTKLGELDEIVLDVEFTYAAPLADGEATRGVLKLEKRDGGEIVRDLECVRYLKN